jgi:hypothetical protein
MPTDGEISLVIRYSHINNNNKLLNATLGQLLLVNNQDKGVHYYSGTPNTM